jgi:hypothetical protein
LPLLAMRSGRPPLDGTFLQFWAAHLNWPTSRWADLFDALSAMHVRRVIIQWCAYDQYDYTPLVERVLALAATAKMRVHVGLHYDSRWWTEFGHSTIAALRLITERPAPPSTFARSAAFAGWYLPEEIDDIHWQTAEARSALAETLRQVRQRLRPLSVSGFSGRALPPAELAAMWRDLARRSRVDEVLFQDGIGAGKMTRSAWPGYAAALHHALGRRLSVVVETFEQTAGGAAFQATPAPLDRVLWQCSQARRPPVAFSLPEYDTPLGGPAAAARHAEYLGLLP